jgi:uncharacterized protein YcaQ
VTVHELSRADARRLAVRAQLLVNPRPSSLLEVVRHLTLLPMDMTDAIAPNVDLVAWSRIGSPYNPDDLTKAFADGTLVELRGLVRPAEQVALFRADMADWPGRGELRDWEEDIAEWVEANDACRQDILSRLRSEGPLPARGLPDTSVVPWRSSGWTNNRNVMKLLEVMAQRGEVAVAGRGGRERLWDLAERVYPDDPPVPAEEADRIRAEQRLRALGIARSRGPVCPGEPMDAGDAGEPAVIEGVRGTWRVDPALLDRPFKGRTALLSPLDQLIYDRKRMTELFDFEYQLEMYKPAAKRRWGYYALPILHGDQLVGKLDATSDHKSGVLWVDAVHEDQPFTKSVTTAVHREIKDLADWLALDLKFTR